MKVLQQVCVYPKLTMLKNSQYQACCCRFLCNEHFPNNFRVFINVNKNALSFYKIKYVLPQESLIVFLQIR